MSDLLKINVSSYVEKKNGLSYLSWANAWAEALKADPLATWTCHTFGAPGNEVPYMSVGKSAMVHVSVILKGIRRDCMLPVMDHRNKAISDPDAFQVNTAIMRCLAKAIGMHGLGLYLYAGEDVPQVVDQETTADKARLRELEEIATYMVDCHRAGEDMKAIDIWYADDTFRDNEERLHVWGFLKPESKLRSAIKANNPAATKEKESV